MRPAKGTDVHITQACMPDIVLLFTHTWPGECQGVYSCISITLLQNGHYVQLNAV